MTSGSRIFDDVCSTSDMSSIGSSSKQLPHTSHQHFAVVFPLEATNRTQDCSYRASIFFIAQSAKDHKAHSLTVFETIDRIEPIQIQACLYSIQQNGPSESGIDMRISQVTLAALLSLGTVSAFVIPFLRVQRTFLSASVVNEPTPNSTGRSKDEIAKELNSGKVLEGGQVIDFEAVKGPSRAEQALLQARHSISENQHHTHHTTVPTAILGINDEVIEEVGHDLGTFADPQTVQQCAAYIRSMAPPGLFETTEDVDPSSFTAAAKGASSRSSLTKPTRIGRSDRRLRQNLLYGNTAVAELKLDVPFGQSTCGVDVPMKLSMPLETMRRTCYMTSVLGRCDSRIYGSMERLLMSLIYVCWMFESSIQRFKSRPLSI